MWCGDHDLSFKGPIPTATSSVHLGDGTCTDRGMEFPGIEFPGIEVRFRHQDGPLGPLGGGGGGGGGGGPFGPFPPPPPPPPPPRSSFQKEFVLLDTDPHAAREKVMSFRLRSFWPI